MLYFNVAELGFLLCVQRFKSNTRYDIAVDFDFFRRIKGRYSTSKFFHNFYKGEYFCDFTFAFCALNPFRIGVHSYRKKNC